MGKHRKTTISQKPQKMWIPHWSQLAILTGVMLLVFAVLLFKNRVTDVPPAAQDGAQVAATLAEAQAIATLPETAGQTPAIAELDQDGGQAGATTLPDELPQAQLERLLIAGQPTLAFFHSDNCVQCTKMMKIVAEVYPEFQDSVALVDIDVYDPLNKPLLQQKGIHAIPTQIFINRVGEGQMVMGAMEPKEFRAWMRSLAGGE